MIKRSNPLRVLLADDEPHMHAFVGQILASLINCTVTAVSDGAQAVAYCRTADPDIAILDINMPRMDGVKALEEIRTLKPYMPIVMMTSIVDELIVEECVNKGASYYIRKDPFAGQLKTELEVMLRDFFPEEPASHEQARNPAS